MIEIDWLHLGPAVLLIAFIVFAFRQGMKVKPLPPGERQRQNVPDAGGDNL
jgi:hypothetical protein